VTTRLWVPGERFDAEGNYLIRDPARRDAARIARRYAQRLQMTDWSPYPQDAAPIVIHTFSQECLGSWSGGGYNGAASATYPAAANAAVYVPFVVNAPMPVVEMGAFNGATAAGNTQLGIYDDQQNLLTASTATAQAGINAWQMLSVTAVTLDPGVYYMAIVSTSASATFSCAYNSEGTVVMGRSMGLLQQASAAPLPNPATFAVASLSRVPLMVVSSVSTI
jgi:hypothetical protein